MRFNICLAILLTLSSLQAFQFPAIFQIKTDEGTDPRPEGADCMVYLLKIINDVNEILPLVENKEWERLLPLTVDLGENLMSAYECFHKSGVSDPCPYIKCVNEELILANKRGQVFVTLLYSGEKEDARKILPEIADHLQKATECGSEA